MTLRRGQRTAHRLSLAIECCKQHRDPKASSTTLFEEQFFSQELAEQDIDMPVTVPIPWSRVAPDDIRAIQWVLWVRLSMDRGPEATRRFDLPRPAH